MYKTLLHLMKTSPSAPFDLPFSISSVFASYPSVLVLSSYTDSRARPKQQLTCRFINPSVEIKYPRYCKPHFSLTLTTLPVNSCRYGFGLTGW